MTKPRTQAIFRDFGTVWRCDICGKPRSAGRHTRCSKERQRMMAMASCQEARPAG
ncbi:MAG: hypothetical protein NDI93_01475 [Pseudomonas sp.]|nr:hypothetical protein [Pseudomonas sp.]